MKREILFKAKRVDNGEWVKGSLIIHSGYAFITGGNQILKTPSKKYNLHTFEGLYEVDPDTVSQYTGLKDRNGKMIFEGDVVKTKSGWYGYFEEYYPEKIAEVVYENNNFTLKCYTHDYWYEQCEIVGNVFDTPELLKESK
jgi:uncharacterized phage protein (TIGR01671 family)